MAKDSKARKLGRPSKKLGRDSHALILDAALDLFSTIGYEAASLKKIAEQVGIRDSAVYAHFSSKADIREQLLLKHGPQAMRINLQNFNFEDAVKEPREFLKRLLRDLLKHWIEPSESKFFRYMLMENLKAETPDSINILSITDRLRTHITGLLTLMIQQKLLRAADPEWLSMQFIAPILAMRCEIAFRKDLPSVDEIEERFDRHVEEYFKAFANQVSA